MLAGIFLDIRGCCDQTLINNIEVTSLSTPCPHSTTPYQHCPSAAECHHCCTSNGVKLLTAHDVNFDTPMYYFVISEFDFNFFPKTVYLSTRPKPPRT